jgi:DNA-binding GntR family transcriptional regulator
MSAAGSQTELERLNPGRDRRESAASRTYRLLRAEIVALQLAPRTKLSEKELSLRLGVSRSPIREALLKLADEGLVVIRPQSGTSVAPINIADVHEGQFVREALETASVESAIANLRSEDTTRLRSILALQVHHARAGEEPEFFQADVAMHVALMQIAGHERSWRLIEQANVQLDRVRRLAVHMPLKMDSLIAEHHEIIDAIIRSDVSAATTVMRRHLRMVFATVEMLLQQHHNFFVDQ